MDAPKHTTLAEALADVPDSRRQRGQRYTWLLLLTLIGAAVASGEKNGRAIGKSHGRRQERTLRTSTELN